MTLKELSQFYHLDKEIEETQQRIKELEEAATRISAPDFEKHSRPTGYVQSKIEALTSEIADLQIIILARQTQCVIEKKRLERYISSIEDSYTRRIFTLRFVNGLTWLQVARKIGRGDTESAVRMTCVRYLEEQNKKSKK